MKQLPPCPPETIAFLAQALEQVPIRGEAAAHVLVSTCAWLRSAEDVEPPTDGSEAG